MRHTPVQACGTRMLRHTVLACTTLLWANLAPATEPGLPVPYEKEPAAWQRAGIEAALKDPAVWVQLSSLYYCTQKKWVAQLPLSTPQWLVWLSHPEPGVQRTAAEAAAQLGAQMPPEVQRALVRLQSKPDGDFTMASCSFQALCQTGTGMIPEVQQAELAYLQVPKRDYERQIAVNEALGRTGAAMTPEVLQSLLALVQGAQTAPDVRCDAANALAHLGPHMPPQVREIILGLLLDPQADGTLRSIAAEAMGHLGPQMPPQAQQLLLAVLRDRNASKGLRFVAAPALAQTGAKMLPEVPQALLDAYNEQAPRGADKDTINNHQVFHQQVEEALGAMGPSMPVAVQRALLAHFLAHVPPLHPSYSALFALEKAGSHADAAVLRALLATLQDKAIDEQVRSSIGEFFQRLAEHGHLPQEVQQAVTTLVQDEAAGLDARCQGALILGQLGEKATAEARHALSSLLKGADPMLRIHALEAMKLLGPHMPPEAIPVLLTILKKRSSPAAKSATAHDAGDISAPVPSGGFMPDLDPMNYAVPALGRLGAQMPPEAPAALLAVLQGEDQGFTGRIDSALALAQLGDRCPPEMQQTCITLLHDPKQDFRISSAICMTLGVSGITPVSDAQLADILSLTREGFDDELRAYFYLWLGRSPAHLQAVRWLGHQKENPPLGGTPPHEILSLISRLWPHTASHAELRHEMARRTSQIITTHLKTRPLDEATQTSLRTLATQLAQDTSPDSATALKQVQAALKTDEQAR